MSQLVSQGVGGSAMEVRVSSSGGQAGLDSNLSFLHKRMPRLQRIESVGNVPNIGRLPAGVYRTGSMKPERGRP